MSYDIVFVRGSVPVEEELRSYMLNHRLDYTVFHRNVATLAEAKRLRLCSGDLVVYAGTLDVVCDEEWLFDWEQGNPESYALGEINKFRSK